MGNYTVEQIDSDKDFNGWLYGGSTSEHARARNDVDLKLKNLVYNCYLADLGTTWSNEGRIGRTLPEAGKKSPEGFVLFEPGFLVYKIKNVQTKELDGLLRKIAEEDQNSQIRESSTGELWFEMEFPLIKMERVKCEWRDVEIDVLPEQVGRERLEQIDSIWKYLTEETGKLVDRYKVDGRGV